ncbi:MAG: sigma-70 family RNA polymerase sigma factor [Acidimicrobiaceae bacterium]|nr:sigma-70 family RNA polymerase sigma factor [Acidimicrobiaceae bacterium]
MAQKAKRSSKLRIVTDPSRNPVPLARSKVRTAEPDELVTWAKSGERQAFDELVRRTHGDAFGLALRLTGNEEDARDVVQDAYLRAYKGLDRFRGDARFSTWLYRIVANCASTQSTKKRRHRHDELPDESLLAETRPDNDPALRGDFVALRDELEVAVQDLPHRLRAVVVLRDVYGLPHEAIAEELGISVSAAKVRLHRARRRLREQLFANEGDEVHAI